MGTISSGIKTLDTLIDSLSIGDNVVWEVDAGTSCEIFMRNFIRQSFDDARKIIYVSFNRSPQSVLNEIGASLRPGQFTLIDCFTSGKGKNDNTFLRFYETPTDVNVVRIVNPRGIEEFTQQLNAIEDSLPPDARYVFDSLTGMQDLWGDENSTYKFFTYMCPRLYDLGTVAYWILEKEAHSQTFKANLRHITQVVIDLYKKREKLFLKALKLDGRTNRDAFKPHSYEIEDNNIAILPVRKEPAFDIGSKIRDARFRLGMSQKDLADKIGLTSSFISQIENNQISPSLNSFLQIADTLGMSPSLLLQKERRSDELPWLVNRETVRERLIEKGPGYSLYRVTGNDKASVSLAVINSSAALDKHFMNHKKEELIYVIRGEVSVRVNNRSERLRPGDSVYLKDAVPSHWSNRENEEAELLVVCI